MKTLPLSAHMNPMPFSPNAADPAGLPVCTCIKAKEPHEHGTRGMYGYHRCRCVPCGDANREYNRQANKHRPRREMVDADLVRARIAKLRSVGLTVAEMADLCGLNSKVLDFAINGRKGRKPALVKASTFRALNAISYRDVISVETPRGRKVDADQARRQIQSLHSFGWGVPDIASRAGVTDATINRILKGFMTTAEISDRINKVHRELHGNVPAEITATQKARASRARTRAAAHAWTPDTSTDHEYARYSRAH